MRKRGSRAARDVAWNAANAAKVTRGTPPVTRRDEPSQVARSSPGQTMPRITREPGSPGCMLLVFAIGVECLAVLLVIAYAGMFLTGDLEFIRAVRGLACVGAASWLGFQAISDRPARSTAARGLRSVAALVLVLGSFVAAAL